MVSSSRHFPSSHDPLLSPAIFAQGGDRPFTPVYKIVGKANACQLPASNETWLSNGLPADKIVRQLIGCVGLTGVGQAPDHPVA